MLSMFPWKEMNAGVSRSLRPPQSLLYHSTSSWRTISASQPTTQHRYYFYLNRLLVLVLIVCWTHSEAFQSHRHRVFGSFFHTSTQNANPAISCCISTGYHLGPANACDHRKNSRLKLYEKSPKTKDGTSIPPASDKNPTQRETKSVVQSFFDKSSDQPLPSNSEQNKKDETTPQKSESWFRSVFRRSKKDNDADETSKDSKRRKKASSSSSQQKIVKPVLSDKLRQQAEESKKTIEKEKQPTKSSKVTTKNKDGNKDSENDDSQDQSSLWNRVTGWIPGRGGGDGDDRDSNSSTSNSNSTNPISALQQFWQESASRRAEEWIDVIPKTRLAPGEVVPVTVGGLDLLIIAGSTSDNRIYAIANSCPHLGTPLEIGQLVRLPKENVDAPSAAGTRSSEVSANSEEADRWTELQVSSILQQDGCEDCIVCPLHRTAFALESGQVRGEWCPYPPVVGKLTGLVKEPTPVATFDVRVRKKSIQVRLNSPLPPDS